MTVSETMGDAGGGDGEDRMEALIARHKHEKKELQGTWPDDSVVLLCLRYCVFSGCGMACSCLMSCYLLCPVVLLYFGVKCCNSLS